MGLTNEEKIRLLEKRRKFILRPRGLYAFHPYSDYWLPLQCDDEGALVIKGE